MYYKARSQRQSPLEKRACIAVSTQIATRPLHMNTFDQEFCNRIQPKLDALEQIRADLNKERVSVPCIAVVGEQSAGKSSVMEYIADIQFPRAENTCTRCPTIASLVCDSSIDEPYATIGLDPDKETHERVDDLSDITAKIEDLTTELTDKIGEGDGIITNDPIYVRVVRSSGPTLTLIDLPGITHMCIDGTQENIHEVTTGLIDQYIRDDNTVVLVVIPATADFGNAEALKMAKKYDPDGARTLGVVTKCDLSKPDDNLVEQVKMEGKHIQLEMGFVALRCRTPSEVKSGLSRDAAMEKEYSLFVSSPHLSRLDETQWGLRTLISRIVSVQSERVDSYVPELKLLLASKLWEAEAELEKLPLQLTTDAARTYRMELMLHRINATLHDILSGSIHLKDKHMHLPSIWDKKVKEFETVLRRATPDFFSPEFKYTLEQNMQEVQGASLPNFISSPVFRKAVQAVYFDKSSSSDRIDGILKKATSTLLSEIGDVMSSAIEALIDEHVSAFPKLASFLKERVEEMIKLRTVSANQYMQTTLFAEYNKPHTHNHYYADTIAKVKRQVQERAEALHENNHKQWEEIHGVSGEFMHSAAESFKRGQSNFDQSILDMQISLFSYCKCMRKCLVDLVAKISWSEIMNDVNNKLNFDLKHTVSHEAELKVLMAEDRATARKRDKITLTIERFGKSLSVLRSI